MENIMNGIIIPYESVGIFKLGMNLETVRKILKDSRIPFNQFTDPNKGCTPEVAWTYIKIQDSLNLVFAHNILFHIWVENNYTGKLINGAFIGIKLDKLISIDDTLIYNEDEEDYESKLGYWITEDIETGLVTSIAIFIEELSGSTDAFYTYEWVNKYQ